MRPNLLTSSTNPSAGSVSWRWRLGLVVASLLLVAVDLALRLTSYRRLCRLLLLTSPTPDPARVNAAGALAYGRLVNKAALPWTTCLRRSLLTWWLMRWGGLPSRVCIGVKLDGGNTSHSWVEHHGQVINDAPEIGELYPIQFSDTLDPSQFVHLA
jgi:hypothetical protein